MRSALFLIALAISENNGAKYEDNGEVLIILFVVFFLMDVWEIT